MARGDEPISVGELSARIKRHLEPPFANVAVTGEISNFKGAHGSGHVYCSLKDADAQIKLIIWRATFERLKFRLQDGLEVTITGKIDVYARRGEYSLVATSVAPKGTGALQLAFRQMYERLRAEGLFDPARKRPLPEFPLHIALITSPTGAAVRDIIATARRRNRLVRLTVVPVKVQGEGAAESVALALRAINAQNERLGFDVAIVTRGGGSLEDLWAFNEEPVARAIHDSAIPVVSAVGHEIDTTIADFVADLRAPTPTAAAELVVPELSAMSERVEESRLRLLRALRGTVEAWGERLEALEARLQSLGPLNQLRREQQRLDFLSEGLQAALRHRLELGTGRVGSLAARLEALSPLAVLQRGYSITRTAQGRVVRAAREVRSGDVLHSRLGDGEVRSVVS